MTQPKKELAYVDVLIQYADADAGETFSQSTSAGCARSARDERCRGCRGCRMSVIPVMPIHNFDRGYYSRFKDDGDMDIDADADAPAGIADHRCISSIGAPDLGRVSGARTSIPAAPQHLQQSQVVLEPEVSDHEHHFAPRIVDCCLFKEASAIQLTLPLQDPPAPRARARARRQGQRLYRSLPCWMYYRGH